MNKEKAANITNLTLGSIMSVDDVLRAYFSNDSDIMIKAIATSVKDPNKMFKAIESANYEIENEELLSKTSSYGDNQKSIVEQLVKPSNTSFLETNIISSEKVLGNISPNLDGAKLVLNNMKQENLGIGMTR